MIGKIWAIYGCLSLIIVVVSWIIGWAAAIIKFIKNERKGFNHKRDDDIPFTIWL